METSEKVGPKVWLNLMAPLYDHIKSVNICNSINPFISFQMY